jgi:cardiolipin synthase A/B
MSLNFSNAPAQANKEIIEADNVQLVRSGSEYFDLVDNLIRGAQDFIHLQTYILDEDETGRTVVNQLITASKRGVKVMLVADAYASQGLSDEFISEMKNEGIQFLYFNPVWKSKYFYFGRRLHHKVLVVDGKHGLVGGINISNHYNDVADQHAWLDWALYVKGPVVLELQKVCEHMAKVEILQRIKRRLYRTRPSPLSPPPIQVRINDWVRGKKEITNTYLKMLRNAHSHITIMSSYLLPGKILRANLRKAARRGVKIRFIMAGISDVRIAKHAERYMYRWMLRNNIEIYEYQPNVLHAKMAVCDSEWLTLGSYNVNNISAYASIELNLDVYHPAFAQEAEARLDQIIENDCVKITQQIFEMHNTLWNRFIQRSAYDIFRLILFLFTFYFRQRE